ncbi:hypothetical protein [Nocardioides sp. YIM 152588]|uniref:hypothetical protein n=1 Tax=Nocardioides sp. YIM 152588 TaxID=3158259 RepID=UPI0032E50CBA
MKKLIVYLLAVALATVGLVTTAATPAQAGCSGYQSCPKPIVVAAAPKWAKKNKTVPVAVKVKIPGNIKPEPGTTVLVKCWKGKSKVTDTDGLNKAGKAHVDLSFAKSGKWKCIAKYNVKGLKTARDRFAVNVK